MGESRHQIDPDATVVIICIVRTLRFLTQHVRSYLVTAKVLVVLMSTFVQLALVVFIVMYEFGIVGNIVFAGALCNPEYAATRENPLLPLGFFPSYPCFTDTRVTQSRAPNFCETFLNSCLQYGDIPNVGVEASEYASQALCTGISWDDESLGHSLCHIPDQNATTCGCVNEQSKNITALAHRCDLDMAGVPREATSRGVPHEKLGVTCSDPPCTDSAFSTSNGPANGGYLWLNFDRLHLALVTLVSVMLENKWHIIMDGFSGCAGGWAKVFFISFYLVAVFVLTNLIVVLFLKTHDIVETQALAGENMRGRKRSATLDQNDTGAGPDGHRTTIGTRCGLTLHMGAEKAYRRRLRDVLGTSSALNPENGPPGLQHDYPNRQEEEEESTTEKTTQKRSAKVTSRLLIERDAVLRKLEKAQRDLEDAEAHRIAVLINN